MTQPFSDIRVLDFTHVIAGPFCTHQLAVLGAEVIKIESPHAPDMVRGEGPDSHAIETGLSAMFLAQNANKRSLSVDLKTPEGKKIVLALIHQADVLVENYRTGALQALGLGYEALKPQNPALIYCSLTGFGQSGPKAHHTAYDNVIQAFSGLMAATGDPQTAPVKVGPPILDYGTGAQAAFAVAAALYHRSQTGEGQRIDIAMLDAALLLMASHVTHYQATGQLCALTGNQSDSKPGYGCYPTQEGLLMLGAYTASQYAKMWQVLGHPQRAEEVEGLPLAELGNSMETDQATITEALRQQTAAQWEEQFNAAKVPAARVRSLDETLTHPQLQTRSVLQNVKGTPLPLPLAAFQFEKNGPKIHARPPKQGEHTDEILTELGYSAESITALRQQGVI